MVKIAIAGASSQLALEVVDALVATGKHEIVTLWRKAPSNPTPGTTPVIVDYASPPTVLAALQGVDTVLSFVAQSDAGTSVQDALIDASIAAGVRRFAPSEWSAADLTHLPWYAGKGDIRARLAASPLEYTLFQPGVFLDYLARPQRVTPHLRTIATNVDVPGARVLVAKGGLDVPYTLTSVRDIAATVVAAVAYEGKWPAQGGLSGQTTTTREVARLVEKVTGKKVVVEELEVEALEKRGLKGVASWVPPLEHAYFDSLEGEEEREKAASGFWAGYLLSQAKGAWETSDEWNKLVGDEVKFQGVESFLEEWWGEGGVPKGETWTAI